MFPLYLIINIIILTNSSYCTIPVARNRRVSPSLPPMGSIFSGGYLWIYFRSQKGQKKIISWTVHSYKVSVCSCISQVEVFQKKLVDTISVMVFHPFLHPHRSILMPISSSFEDGCHNHTASSYNNMTAVTIHCYSCKRGLLLANLLNSVTVVSTQHCMQHCW